MLSFLFLAFKSAVGSVPGSVVLGSAQQSTFAFRHYHSPLRCSSGSSGKTRSCLKRGSSPDASQATSVSLPWPGSVTDCFLRSAAMRSFRRRARADSRADVLRCWRSRTFTIGQRRVVFHVQHCCGNLHWFQRLSNYLPCQVPLRTVTISLAKSHCVQ